MFVDLYLDYMSYIKYFKWATRWRKKKRGRVHFMWYLLYSFTDCPYFTGHGRINNHEYTRPQWELGRIIHSVRFYYKFHASDPKAEFRIEWTTSSSMGPWRTSTLPVRTIQAGLMLVNDIRAYPYRMQTLQTLKASDKKQRSDMAVKMLEKIEKTPVFLNLLWTSDESHSILTERQTPICI